MAAFIRSIVVIVDYFKEKENEYSGKEKEYSEKIDQLKSVNALSSSNPDGEGMVSIDEAENDEGNLSVKKSDGTLSIKDIKNNNS